MASLNSHGIFETLDLHTAGEPLRIITRGLPDLPGNTMLAKRRYFSENFDPVRRLLMMEPRGHADMYGAVLTRPVSPDSDTGILFMHNEGYSTMCGHAIIALVIAGVEQKLFPIADLAAIRIDTPAGQIVARANFDKHGRVTSASFLNVPSFVLEPEYSVQIQHQTVDMTIAFGGAFYAYVDARQLGLSLQPPEANRLIEWGRKIKQAVTSHYVIQHPDGDADLNFLYGTIFVLPGKDRLHSRNVCVFADGELDRSPTGTGVSGRAAIQFARKELALGEEMTVESILGTTFSVRCVESIHIAGHAAVIPEVTGTAVITGEHRFRLDSRDCLPHGFMLR